MVTATHIEPKSQAILGGLDCFLISPGILAQKGVDTILGHKTISLLHRDSKAIIAKGIRTKNNLYKLKEQAVNPEKRDQDGDYNMTDNDEKNKPAYFANEEHSSDDSVVDLHLNVRPPVPH